MEKEKQVIKYCSEKDLHNMETLENGCRVLSNFAAVFAESTNPKDHIEVQNPRDENVIVDFGENSTFSLAIEGMVNGAATELYQEGFKDIVQEVFKMHGITMEVNNGER